MTARQARAALVGYALASGAAAVVLASVSHRLLGLVVAAPGRAGALVLAAFGAGLAAGAALVARRVDRMQRPLRWLAALEVASAAWAFSLAGGAAALRVLLPVLARGVDPAAGFLGRIAEAAAAVVTALPVAALLGSRLTVLARSGALDGSADARTRFPKLLSLTVAGGAGGALAGEVLPTTMGIVATLMLTGAISLALAPGVLASTGRLEPGCAAPVARAEARAFRERAVAVTVVALAGAILSVSAIGWRRAVVLAVGRRADALTATIVLFAIAIGIAAAGVLARRGRATPFVLGAAPVGAALAALALVPAAGALPAVLPSLGGSIAVHVAVTLAIAGLPIALAAAAVPLATAVGVGEAGRDAGTALVAAGAGATAGALAAGPAIALLGIAGALRAAAAVCILAGAAAWLELPAHRRRAARALGVVVPLAAVLALAPSWDPTDAFGAQGLLAYEEGPGSTLGVLRNGTTTSLAVDGEVEWTDGSDLPTQLLLAHVPALLHPGPRTALVLGLGTGVTAGALAAHPIDRIDVVDSDPAARRASQPFDTASGAPLGSPRVHLVRDGPRRLLAAGGRRYDVVVSAPPEPSVAGGGGLLTRDAYEEIRGVLAPGGIAVLRVRAALGLDALRTALATFQAVFPHASVWRAARGDLLLVGTERPPRLDLAAISRRIAALPDVREDLTAALGDVELFPWLFVLGEDEARAFASGAPLDTDEHPRLERLVPIAPPPLDVDATLRAFRAFRRSELPALEGLDTASARSPAGRMYLARGFLRQGAREDGLEQLERAGDPARLPLVLRVERACLLVELGRADAALPELLVLEALAPGDPRVARYLTIARALPVPLSREGARR